tara:strand:+ start:126 stop:1082 length:957 start_codon:yes stop_codon:yes gene_type:complete
LLIFLFFYAVTISMLFTFIQRVIEMALPDLKSKTLIFSVPIFEIIFAGFFGYFNPIFFGLMFVQVPFVSILINIFSPFIIPIIAVMSCLFFFEKKRAFYTGAIIFVVVLAFSLNLYYDKKQSNVCIGMHTEVHKIGRKHNFNLNMKNLVSFARENKKVPIWLFPEALFSNGNLVNVFFRMNRQTNQYIFFNRLTKEKPKKSLLIGINNKKRVVFKHQKRLVVPFYEKHLDQDLLQIRKNEKRSNLMVLNHQIIPFICMEIFKWRWPFKKDAKKIVMYSANLSDVQSMTGKFICFLIARMQAAFQGASLCEAVNAGFKS